MGRGDVRHRFGAAEIGAARDGGGQVSLQVPKRRLRAALPWILFGTGLLLATEPVWRLALLGYDPSLDDLLQIRCFTPA
jgi:hypothetical protein